MNEIKILNREINAVDKKKIQKTSNYYNQPLLFLKNNTCYKD